MRAVVLVASNRAAAGTYEDTTGPLLADALRAWGYETPDPVVVGDGAPFGAALREALATEPAVVLSTGGTGVSPTDRTPEETRPLLERELPGVAEALRAYGVAHGVPTAMVSRGLAGLAGRTVVVNLPGSRGGVRDGLVVLEGVLGHLVDQVHGGDHVREDP